MAATCDIRGASLRIAPDQFPDPVRDLDARGAAERSAVLAGGCFWCVEAVFRELDGVLEVTSGYAGGRAADADYRSVCSGDTGHAEVVRVCYDPRRLSYGQLLKVFFAVAHDPTQRNRQGN
ncbi:MAG TPA: peptide-methionine (S)-S-oxide reductase, partial [Mizugakiibacter sp.]